MRDLGDSVLGAEAILGSRAAAWDAVLATVAATHGLADDPGLDVLAPWRADGALDRLGAVHEHLVAARQASGTFYTPPALVAWVLDRTLGAPHVLDPARGAHVLDPACGAGHFLVAAAERLVAAGHPPADAVAQVHGVDLDPVAVAITRLRLRVLAADASSEPDVRVGDGLGEHPGAPYDVVVGNPPFLGQLRRRTSGAPVPGLGPYTDTSAVFLARALDLVGPGGVVALVQPRSLLAARDAAPVRTAVKRAGAITGFWSSPTPVFDGTTVLTCAPVIVVGADQGGVDTWHGRDFAPGPTLDLPSEEWGPLAATAGGIPRVAAHVTAGPPHGVLGDLGPCTADFRDQYYGLVPFVHDGGPGAPLLTSGLIDPAHNRWGEVPTRFAKTRYAAPTVDLDALRAEGSLARWAAARLVPKVLVATQGRVIEAVVDEAGDWLPSVPVLTLAPPPERLWHALAVLLAPPVVALAAARYLGTALAPTAIKLSARQVAALPLPAASGAWDRGASLARLAQHAAPADRHAALVACAEAMCAAYDDSGALTWWRERAVRV